MKFTRIAFCILTAGIAGALFTHGNVKAYAQYEDSANTGSKYYRMGNTLIPFKFKINTDGVDHDISITFVRTEIDGKFSAEPVAPGTYINGAFISFDGSAPIDLSEKFGVTFDHYLPEFNNTPHDIRQRVNTVLQQASENGEGPYYSIENFRYLSSPDNMIELFQVDNTLFLRKNGKVIQIDFDEKRLYSSSIESDASIMEIAGVEADKFPPFLTQWIEEDKSLFSRSISTEHSDGPSLSREAMKQLLKGVSFEENPSYVKVLRYCCLGNTYMVIFRENTGYSSLYDNFYSAIYDQYGQLLDTVWLGTECYVDIFNESYYGRNCISISPKCDIISVERGRDCFSSFRHNLEYFVTPIKFIVKKGVWQTETNSPNYFWIADPWSFIKSIPESSTDYNMWEYVFFCPDGEYGADAPIDLANLIRRNPKSFELWQQKNETKKLSKNVAIKNDSRTINYYYEYAEQDSTETFSIDCMPETRTLPHYANLVQVYKGLPYDDSHDLRMLNIFQGENLNNKLAEYEQTVSGTFNGKDLDRLTIFPQFNHNTIDGEECIVVGKYIIASENGTTSDLIIDPNWPSPIRPTGEGLCLGSYEYDGYPRLKLKIDDKNPAHPQLIVSRYEGEGGFSEYTAWYKLNDKKWTMTKAIYEEDEYNEQEESLEPVTYELINGKWVKTNENSKDTPLSDASSEDSYKGVPVFNEVNLDEGALTLSDPFSKHGDIKELARMEVPIQNSRKAETFTPTYSEEEIFVAVEQQAEFPGGQAALMKWINTNLRYPETAEQNDIQGRVIVKFVVEKDGSIGAATIAKSVDSDLDREALRIVKKMPRWHPAKNNGQAVRSYYTIPVTFKLQNR